MREPFAALQAALLGVVGLILAFGLALAVGRYESRRAAVVEEANAIGTTYLRAQTLAEPFRTASLERLISYTDTSIRLSDSVPSSSEADEAVADGQGCSGNCGRSPANRSILRPPPARRGCTSRPSTR